MPPLNNGNAFPILTLDAVGDGTLSVTHHFAGSYSLNGSPCNLQSTGVVLDMNGKVITAVYSSGAIGRLVAEDVIGFVRYVKSKA